MHGKEAALEAVRRLAPALKAMSADHLWQLRLEERCFATVPALAKEHGWDEVADLVKSTGSVDLFATEEEVKAAKASLDAAAEAGIDTTGVEWLSVDQAAKVCQRFSNARRQG